jgi:hypothetical protein
MVLQRSDAFEARLLWSHGAELTCRMEYTEVLQIRLGVFHAALVLPSELTSYT